MGTRPKLHYILGHLSDDVDSLLSLLKSSLLSLLKSSDLRALTSSSMACEMLHGCRI